MKKIFFVTGVSGVGKTTTIKNLEKIRSDLTFFYFDNIGVPSVEEMIKNYGSPEGWQNSITGVWIKKILNNDSISRVILEGQMRLSFIIENCKINNFNNYEIVLFDCTDVVRESRLISRGQPELVNQDMKNWANLLRKEAINFNCQIIDSTNLSQEESVEKLIKIIDK